MAMKNREANKILRELLAPLGFKQIRRTRVFVRKAGEDIFQAVYWWSPFKDVQKLYWWIESAYSDPKWLFHGWLNEKNGGLNTYWLRLPSSAEVSKIIYEKEEYQPKWIDQVLSEQEQLKIFRESILPRLQRWTSQKDVYLSHIGIANMSYEGESEDDFRYWCDKDLNLAILLEKEEDVNKYLDIPEENYEDIIKFHAVLYSACFPERKESADFSKRRDQEILRELKHRRDIVKDEELVNDYLEYCRSTNLRDFNDLLMGKCGVEFN